MNRVRQDHLRNSTDAWYCVRTQPKHEHIAAAHLRRTCELDVFCPKLRIRKPTKRGAVWFVEALFPGYVFARFNWVEDCQRVKGTNGVSTVVTFGAAPPVIEDRVIESLRAEFDAEEVHEVPQTLEVGQTITIAGGAFHGLEATVLRVMSPPTRVHVLLEMLGGTTRAEVPVQNIARNDAYTPPHRLKASR